MDNLPLYKRYTPPSCTLSIYNPPSFFPLKKDNLSPDYSFELNFDDPRSPNQEKITIKGDRTSLEKLRITANQYINHYLNSLDLDHNSEEIESDKKQFKLYFKPKLQHQLVTPESEHITLNNTQLLDLINALESFYIDFLHSQNTNLVFAPLQWGLGLSAIALIIIGAIWWHNRQIIVEENDQEIETTDGSDLPSFPEVEPPTPLDRDLLPPIALPDVPDSLLQSQPLPPLDTPIPQPPGDTMGGIPSASDDTPAIFIPGSPNLLERRDSSPRDGSGNEFVIPAPPSEIAPAPQPLPRLGSTRPTLPDVPQLQARNPESGIPDTEQNDTSEEETPQEKIKQYFAAQWQPPESLTQSIEYRLIVDEKGSITRVTPIGQMARVYLDRTPIPLQGEEIISPLKDSQSVTIRLILSPNGDVVTFKE